MTMVAFIAQEEVTSKISDLAFSGGQSDSSSLFRARVESMTADR